MVGCGVLGGLMFVVLRSGEYYMGASDARRARSLGWASCEAHVGGM